MLSRDTGKLEINNAFLVPHCEFITVTLDPVGGKWSAPGSTYDGFSFFLRSATRCQITDEVVEVTIRAAFVAFGIATKVKWKRMEK